MDDAIASAITQLEERFAPIFRDAGIHCLMRYGEPINHTLWHYTTGENLVRILGGDTLWTTQISCLNDENEVLHSMHLLDASIRARVETSKAEIKALYERILGYLKDADSSYEGLFIACFSRKSDDLSQWRAYGGGEGGYAIGFKSNDLYRPHNPDLFGDLGRILRPVVYDDATKLGILNSILNALEETFLSYISKSPNSQDPIADFCVALSEQFRPFSAILKNFAYEAENEWRIIQYLSDRKQLHFVGRRNIITRHLPIKFSSTPGRLPIAGVVVGPSQHKRLNVISVRDILYKAGYDEDVISNVKESIVPYRDFN